MAYDTNGKAYTPPWAPTYYIGSSSPQCNYKVSSTTNSATLAY